MSVSFVQQRAQACHFRFCPFGPTPFCFSALSLGLSALSLGLGTRLCSEAHFLFLFFG
jgi:hypothetical protein